MGVEAKGLKLGHLAIVDLGCVEIERRQGFSNCLPEDMLNAIAFLDRRSQLSIKHDKDNLLGCPEISV